MHHANGQLEDPPRAGASADREAACAKVSAPKRRSAFAFYASRAPSDPKVSSCEQLLLLLLSRLGNRDAASPRAPFVVPLTFIEFPACKQIFHITSHGDTSALQGKHLTVEERGTAAGRCAALFLHRPSDRDCVICGVIKKAGLDLGGMLSERSHSGLQTVIFSLSSLRCCTRWRRHTSPALPWLPGN